MSYLTRDNSAIDRSFVAREVQDASDLLPGCAEDTVFQQGKYETLGCYTLVHKSNEHPCLTVEQGWQTSTPKNGRKQKIAWARVLEPILYIHHIIFPVTHNTHTFSIKEMHKCNKQTIYIYIYISRVSMNGR